MTLASDDDLPCSGPIQWARGDVGRAAAEGFSSRARGDVGLKPSAAACPALELLQMKLSQWVHEIRRYPAK